MGNVTWQKFLDTGSNSTITCADGHSGWWFSSSTNDSFIWIWNPNTSYFSSNCNVTAFLENILSMTKAEFSAVQLGYYLRLILGLDFPPQQTSDWNCFGGRVSYSLGYHWLDCSSWSGLSWAQGHNLIVAALGFENRRLGLSVVDIDAAMLRQCTHHNLQALGDILVRTTDLEIIDNANGHCSSRK